MHFFQKTKGPVAESRETGGVLARFAAMVGSLAGGVQRRKTLVVLSVVLVCLVATPFFAFAVSLNPFEYVAHAILSATGMLTGLAGLLLNYAISKLVLGMGEILSADPSLNLFGTSVLGLGLVVEQIWTVIRDVCNIVFIFGLIFIGFQTILNVETLNTKKTLVAIIVGALLINFSLFFTKVIIDVSNALAVTIHQEITIPDGNDYENYGIAGVFLQNMGLMGFWDSTHLTSFNVTAGGNFAFFFMGMIFLLIAAFVFAAGGIYLIIRFVALMLIMMFSPILFAAAVFPQTQAMAKSLWKKLFSYAFFAPIYLFLLVLTAKVLGATKQIFDGNLGDVAKASDGEVAVEAFSIVLNFSIAIVMLIASLIIAKQLGVAGADKSVGMLRSAGKGARSRFQGMLGRQTLGRLSGGAENLNDRLEGSRGGRVLKGAITGLSLGTFDEQTRRKIFKAGKESKYGGSFSHKETVDFKKKRSSADTRRKNLQEAEEAYNLAYEHRDMDPDAFAHYTAELAKVVSNLSNKELDAGGFDFVNKPHIAMNLTANQIKHIEGSEEFTENNVTRIKNTRKSALKDITTSTNPQVVSTQIARLFTQKPGAIATLPAELLKDHVERLPIAALGKMYVDDTITGEEQKELRDKIETAAKLLPPESMRNPAQAHVAKLKHWLDTNNIGEQFGVSN